MQTVEVSKEYENLFVALKSGIDNTVVGKGKTPLEAITEAEKNGIKEPVITFISKDEENIYIL